MKQTPLPRRKVHQPHLSIARDARAVRTRERFRRALLELLEVKQIEQITIRNITLAADLNYVTFFRHYETKDALLDEIAADEIKHLVELALPAFDAAKTKAAATAFCGYVNQHRKLWTTLLAGGAAATLRQTYIDIARKVAKARVSAMSWPPQEIGVTIIVSSTIELLKWWLQQKKPLSVAEVAAIQEGFIIMPALRASHPPKHNGPIGSPGA